MTNNTHDCMADKKALESLKFEELALLNERKEALKKDHEAYVDAHSEIKTLLSAFMAALLLEKPADVLAFAQSHFATYKPQFAEVRVCACIAIVRVLWCMNAHVRACTVCACVML